MAKDLSINTTYLSDTQEALNVAREKYCNASSSANTSSSTSSKTTTTAKEDFKESQLEAKNNTSTNTSSSNSSTNNTNTNTSSSSVNKATEALNSLNEDIKKDYSNVINDLNNYIEKANDLENKLSNAAKNELSDKDTTKSGLPKMTTSTISNAVAERKYNQMRDDYILNATEDYNNQVNAAKEKVHKSEVANNRYANREVAKANQYVKDEYNINSKFKEQVDATIKEAEENLKKLETVKNETNSNKNILTNEELTIANSLSITTVGAFIWSGVESLFTGKDFKDVLAKNLNKSVNVTNNIATAELSISEGAESLVEDLVKGLGVITIKGNPTLNNSIKEDNIESLIGTEYSKTKYNNFYTNNLFGSYLKGNVENFDTKRNVGNTVGYIAPAIGIELLTGGSGVASTVIGGVSQTGKGTTEALNEGATFDEASTYGVLRGALTASTAYAGKAISGLNLFGTGTSTQVLANSASHVTLDGGLGVVSTLLDTSLKTVYTPRNKLNELGFNSEEEWNNAPFSEKYDSRFNEIGGWSTVGKNAMVGMAFSSVFEGISAVKQISDINKANNVYSQLQQNNNALNNIVNNTDNIDDEIRSATIDSLVTERNAINESYNSLTPTQKYYFELNATKDAINNGTLSSNGINTIINSGNVRNINAGLSKSEQLSLIKQMDDNQLFSFMSKLDTKDAKSLISNNTSYFNDRFFNTSSANTTWSNSTNNNLVVLNNNLSLTNSNFSTNNNSIITSSYITPLKLNGTISGITDESINMNIFRNRAYDAESTYISKIDDTLQEFNDYINPNSAVVDKKNAITIVQKKYGEGTQLETTINGFYAELDSVAKSTSSNLINISTNGGSTDEIVNNLSSELSLSRQKLVPILRKLEDTIIEYKAGSTGIFDSRNTAIKAYQAVKKDVEALDNRLMTIGNKIQTEKTSYESTVTSLGKELLNESDLSKLNEVINPPKIEPVSEELSNGTISRDTSRSNILTTDKARNRVNSTNNQNKTSKIGFQFFADSNSEVTDNRIATARNRVFEGGLGLGRNTPTALSTNSSKIYRTTGYSQIEDIVECGYVRPKEGKLKGGHENEVFWSKGGDKLFYYDKRPVIQFDSNKMTNDQIGALSIEDIDAIWIFDEVQNKYVNKIDYYKELYRKNKSNNVLTTEEARSRVNSTNNQNETSKIGFQFFANKKSNNLLSTLFNKKENATDVFFTDFDNKTNTYGVNQEFIKDNVSYSINPNDIPFSRNDFYNYLSSRYPNVSLTELKNKWDGLFQTETTISNPSEIISYLASRNQRLGKTIIGDIDRAIEEFESMSTKHQSSEYIKLQDYLTNKGMTTSEATNLLTFMNTTGVCSYTDIVNEILTSYRNNPKLFREDFGYGLYTYTDGKKTLNGNQLLLDLYTFVNTYYKDEASTGALFRISSDGSLHINNLDTSSQVYLEKDDYQVVDAFLKSKNSSLSFQFKNKIVKPLLDPDKVKHQIKEALKNGNVGITIYSKSQNEKYSSMRGYELGEDGTTTLYDQYGNYQIDTENWNEGEAHAMFVTGCNSRGVIVSSWGRRFIIDYEDLANNFYRIRFSNIGGIE